MNNKGITPVVATVLLMTITVAATASAFTFMTGIQNDFMQNTEDRISDREREAQSDINIETAYNSTDGYIIANVRNTGEITLIIENDQGNRVWNLYVDGVPTEWEYLDPSNPKTSIPPQDTVNINTTAKFPADETSIKIAGTDGVSDTIICYNSGSPSC